MKPIKNLQAAPGAAIALALVVAAGVGVYAAANWFGGNVNVKQTDPSLLSVDLSSCKGNMPPGVNSDTDRHNIQFKILGQPHISAENLQHTLLAQCEYNAVLDFYLARPDMKDHPITAYASATVKNVADKNSITLQYFWGGKPVEKTFQLASGATIFDQGQAIELNGIHAGDNVIFTLPAAHVGEGFDPAAAANQLQTLFKTQYDTRQSPDATKGGFYDDSKIMPLDSYSQPPRQSPGPHAELPVR